MKIQIEKANNGIIKTVSDDNYDGAGKRFEKKELFLIKKDSITDTEEFLNSIIKDLALYTGNQNDKEVLKIQKTYGSKYNFNHEDLNNEQKVLRTKLAEIKRIKEHING